VFPLPTQLPEGSYYCTTCDCNNESALDERIVDINKQIESRRWWLEFWVSLADLFRWRFWRFRPFVSTVIHFLGAAWRKSIGFNFARRCVMALRKLCSRSDLLRKHVAALLVKLVTRGVSLAVNDLGGMHPTFAAATPAMTASRMRDSSSGPWSHEPECGRQTRAG
jgi:hypothetical protein